MERGRQSPIHSVGMHYIPASSRVKRNNSLCPERACSILGFRELSKINFLKVSQYVTADILEKRSKMSRLFAT